MQYAVHNLSDPTTMATLDRIWGASQDADDRGFHPRGGWWSLSAWADKALLLFADETAIGGVALKRAPDGAGEVRLALLPEHRAPQATDKLVRVAMAAVSSSDTTILRLTLPAEATWARDAAAKQGLTIKRATLVMLRPSDAGPLPASTIPGLHIQPLAGGEEGRLLHALNHAWAGTWNFRPLTRRALERDLASQREGFLLAVDADNRIAGTIHAQFDRAGHNPDGASFAWISNLTTAPEWRGRGLGRALLSAALAHLHDRGAKSVMLGVDSGAVAPLTLYRSAGFQEIDRLEMWEKPIHRNLLVPETQDSLLLQIAT